MNLKQYFTNLVGYITKDILRGKAAVGNKVMTLEDVVNTYNQPYVRHFPAPNGPIDAQIFKNTPARNTIIAGLIASEAKRTGLDPIYLAACIMQESMFSEGCFNHNLKEHNGIESFAGSDWGICQQSGTYLPERPGMAGLTNDQMATKACTAEWAVPAMADIMAANIHSFTKLLSSNHVLAANLKEMNTTALSDVEWISTLAYNKGSNGAISIVTEKNTTLAAHPYEVATHYSDFCKAMGITL